MRPSRLNWKNKNYITLQGAGKDKSMHIMVSVMIHENFSSLKSDCHSTPKLK